MRRIVDAHHHLWDLDVCHYPWLMARGVERFFGDPTPIQKNYGVADLREDAAGYDLVASVHVQVGVTPGDEVRETAWLQQTGDADGLPSAIVAYCELDKLSANISIGRNMAGVHYYSDYYDSARMGERIAVGILLEQAPSYGETVLSSFKSFDGDYITISGEGGSAPSLSVLDRDGNAIDPRDWWLRHVSGREFVEDL